jgi:hypothetical protein
VNDTQFNVIYHDEKVEDYLGVFDVGCAIFNRQMAEKVFQ